MIKKKPPLSKSNSSWWEKWRKYIWAAIVLISGYFGFEYCKPQFDVEVIPLEIKIEQGGRGETNASIRNTSLIGLPYKKPVNLEAKSQLQDIKLAFSPDAPTLPNYDCKVSIEVGRNVTPGKYKITLIGTGENGKSSSADFFITVIVPPCPSSFVKDVEQYFTPSGWMCNLADIKLDTRCTDAPYSGTTCTKINYLGTIKTPCQTDGWIGAGIYWFCVGCNWGENKPDPVKYNFSCAKSLVFMARGARGGEKAEFKVGGVTGKYNDGINPPRATGLITLTNKWTSYRIDFNPEDDLKSMISGFCWVTNRDWNPEGCTIYLDDIKFVDR